MWGEGLRKLRDGVIYGRPPKPSLWSEEKRHLRARWQHCLCSFKLHWLQQHPLFRILRSLGIFLGINHSALMIARERKRQREREWGCLGQNESVCVCLCVCVQVCGRGRVLWGCCGGVCFNVFVQCWEREGHFNCRKALGTT